MTMETLSQNDAVNRPALLKDSSFWGLNLTQFFGAFNDNLFKQLVMLLCLDQARIEGGRDLQGIAMVLFAMPFILISGYAGFLSDRYSKRTVIVLCKLAEVIITLLGMTGFVTGNLWVLLAVLCLMGIHSAFFGPAKYGILPEMLRASDLPRANGIILMATFLAIIFGLSAAGWAKQNFSSTLWVASIPCVIIALVGLGSSLMLRKTPIAQPGLQWEMSSIFISPETLQLLKNHRDILGVLVMSSVFWFVGGTIYPPAINAFGKEQFGFDDTITGILAASTGVGIAFGCVIAGILSKNRVRAWIVRAGAWGLTISLLTLALPGPGWTEIRNEIRTHQANSKQDTSAANSKKGNDKPSDPDQQANLPAVTAHPFYRGTLLGPYGSGFALIAVGLFAGFYSVPLQVYLQSNAPGELKGRIIAAMNLFNWIGIFAAGLIYLVGRVILVETLQLPQATLFGFAALLMLPVALLYRPPETKVET